MSGGGHSEQDEASHSAVRVSRDGGSKGDGIRSLGEYIVVSFMNVLPGRI